MQRSVERLLQRVSRAAVARSAVPPRSSVTALRETRPAGARVKN